MKRLLPVFVCAATAAAEPSLTISTGFPGASAVLVAADPVAQAITITPATFPQGGWRTWWACDVLGLDPARPLRVTMTDHVRASAKAPVISCDGGVTWRYHHEKAPVGGATARLAWFVPYTLADAQASIAAAVASGRGLRAGTLATSPGGRPVPMLRGGTPGKPVVWLQARQHAWEVASSWAADGVITWLANDPAAKDLLERANVVVVPIMDVDSVETGAGGKDQQPVDFNRDWHGEPHWPAVRAAQAELKRHAAAPGIALMLDLHNPGGVEKEVEFWCTWYSQLPRMRRQATDRFLTTLQAACGSGPVPFKGTIHEKASSAKPLTAALWVRNNTGESTVSGTLEIPVAPIGKEERPPEHQRAFGAGLAAAILDYLRQP